MLEIEAVRMEFPADANIIVGQSHFIKTVEDLYEAVSTTVPQAKFGLAFNETFGACLTRADGNEDGLRDTAIRNARALGCGHVFVLLIQNAYRINVLNAIRNVPNSESSVGPFCVVGRPPFRRDLQRHHWRKACSCHWSTVLGFISSAADFHPVHTLDSNTHKRRNAG